MKTLQNVAFPKFLVLFLVSERWLSSFMCSTMVEELPYERNQAAQHYGNVNDLSTLNYLSYLELDIALLMIFSFY